MGFPILHIIEAEAECRGEFSLREAETYPDSLHIHLSGESGLGTLSFPFEVVFDLV